MNGPVPQHSVYAVAKTFTSEEDKGRYQRELRPHAMLGSWLWCRTFLMISSFVFCSFFVFKATIAMPSSVSWRMRRLPPPYSGTSVAADALDVCVSEGAEADLRIFFFFFFFGAQHVTSAMRVTKPMLWSSPVEVENTRGSSRAGS